MTLPTEPDSRLIQVEDGHKLGPATVRKVERLARAAARADIRRGDHSTGLRCMSLIAKAAKARQEGKTREQFFAELEPDERAWLGC